VIFGSTVVEDAGVTNSTGDLCFGAHRDRLNRTDPANPINRRRAIAHLDCIVSFPARRGTDNGYRR
jgi:hypothetical protein